MSAVGDTFEISVKTQDVIGMLLLHSHCSPEEIQKDLVVFNASWHFFMGHVTVRQK